MRDPAGSSAAAVAAVAECAACGGLGVGESVGVGPGVMELAEPVTEQGVGEEAAWCERTAEIVSGQTVGETSVLVVVAAAAADEPASGATAWTAGAGGLAGTAAGIIVLGS